MSKQQRQLTRSFFFYHNNEESRLPYTAPIMSKSSINSIINFTKQNEQKVTQPKQQHYDRAERLN